MNASIPRRRSVPLLLSFVLTLPLTFGCKKKADAAPEVLVSVQAAYPTEGRISEEIAADAILAPIAEAAISPRISAPIRAEYVQRGGRVRRGQLLVLLEDRDLRGNALDSTGAVASAQANYTATTQTTIPEEVVKAELDRTQAKAALDVAARTARERQALYKQGALSGREADAAEAAQVQAQATYDAAGQHAGLLQRTTRVTDTQAARGQLLSAQGRLESARAQMSFSRLYSPIDGIVTDRPLFPGETAAAGTPVVTVMDTSSLLAKLHLAQPLAQKLKLGDPATISVPGMEHTVSGTVSFLSPALDTGSTTVEVWLKLPNRDGSLKDGRVNDARLKVGTSVHAIMQGLTVPYAMQLPATAIVPGEDGGTDVVVVSAGGTTRKQAVKIGIRTASSVEIVSGLSARDLVVIEGGYGLDDGTRVTVGKAGAAPEGRP